MNTKEKKVFLQKITPFNLLHEARLTNLAEWAEVKSFARDSFVFKQGDFSHGFLYIVVSGQMKILVSDNQGIDRVVSFRHPGDFFGETAFFTRDDYPASVSAVKKTVCLRLPEIQFSQAMVENLDFTIFFNRLLVDRMRLLYQKFVFEGDIKSEAPLLSRKASEVMSKEVYTCSPEDSAHNIALSFGKRSVSSVVVVEMDPIAGTKRPVGIITERDLVTRVVGVKVHVKSTEITARQIMSKDLITVTSGAFLYQVFQLMAKHNIKHIVVADDNILSGMITTKDIAAVQTQKPLTVITDIESTESFAGLAQTRQSVDKVIYTILQERATSPEICTIVSEFYDRVTRRVVELAELCMQEKGYGAPPSEYCLIIMGSGGRKEQYLPTDQDHAIIFRSPAEEENKLRTYFMQLGEEIVTGLEMFGFKRCKGDVMANNKNWCLSITEWIDLVEKWASYLSAEPKSVMQMSIFLDFRWIFGNRALSEELKSFVTETFQQKGRPIRFLALDSALSKGSPINIFGKVRTQRTKKGNRYIDVKKDGCIHVVDCVRLFALKHGVQETNTGKRIQKLVELDVFKDSFKKDIEDIREAYEILMKFRIEDSYEKLRRNENPDNKLEWEKLTRHQQALLRQALVMVNRILSITSYHYRRDDRLI